MNTISKEAFQRLFLLALTASMDRGVFGRFRLQKLVCLAEKDADVRPFTFRKDQAGAFSKDLANRCRELVESGLLIEKEMPGREDGWNYYLAHSLDSRLIRSLMGALNNNTLRRILDTVQEHGYKTTEELRETIYAEFPRLKSFIPRIVVLSAQINDEIEIDGFDEEDIEDLQLLLTPRLVSNMRQLAEYDQSTEVDMSGVAELDTSV